MYILSTEIITAFTSYLCHSDMYVKEHDNVSILYADVVKYAQLTVSLPVSKLVETLNELFGRFDEASQVINQWWKYTHKRQILVVNINTHWSFKGKFWMISLFTNSQNLSHFSYVYTAMCWLSSPSTSSAKLWKRQFLSPATLYTMKYTSSLI